MASADPNSISKEDFLAVFGHGDLSYSENARARAQKQEEKTLQEAYQFLNEDQNMMKHTITQVMHWRHDEI